AAPNIVLAVGLAGCAATSGPSAAQQAEAAPARISPSRVEALIDEIAALRRLPQRAPIPVYFVDDADFLAAYHDRTQVRPNANAAASAASFLEAFDLLPETKSGARRPSTAREVMDEQVLAYYDFEQHHIIAR